MRSVMAVDIAADLELRPGRTRRLFQHDYVNTVPVRNYDVSPDRQGFLMVRGEGYPLEEVTELQIVLNWFEELKRLVPTGVAE